MHKSLEELMSSSTRDDADMSAEEAAEELFRHVLFPALQAMTQTLESKPRTPSKLAHRTQAQKRVLWRMRHAWKKYHHFHAHVMMVVE